MTCLACHHDANPALAIPRDYSQCSGCQRGFSSARIHTCNGRALCATCNGVTIEPGPVFELPKSPCKVVTKQPTLTIARKGKQIYQLWTLGDQQEWWPVPNLDDAVKLTPGAMVRE